MLPTPKKNLTFLVLLDQQYPSVPMIAILDEGELCYIYEEFNKYKFTIHSDL